MDGVRGLRVWAAAPRTAGIAVAVAALVSTCTAGAGAGGALAFGTMVRFAGHVRQLTGISCPSVRVCLAVDSVGEVVSSSDLTRPNPRWSITTIDSAPGPAPNRFYLTAISCPSTNLCVAVDSSGRVVTTTRPTGGSDAWQVTAVDGSNSFRAVSCPDPTLCVAVDDDGDVIASTNPAGGSGVWTVTHVPATRRLTSVSCPTRRLCVATAVGAHGGTLLVSDHPSGGAHSWSVLTGISRHGFQSIACASARLCVATDVGGYVTTATRPLGGRPAWTNAHVDDQAESSRSDGFIIPAVDCPSSTFCLALDDVGKALWSTRPAGGREAWTIQRRPDGSGTFRGVDCPSVRLCVAIDEHALVAIRRPA